MMCMDKAVNAALDKAAASVGGYPQLAVRMGIKRQALYQWKKIPPERVLEIEDITGVPRHELRPDLWPPPRDANDHETPPGTEAA